MKEEKKVLEQEKYYQMNIQNKKNKKMKIGKINYKILQKKKEKDKIKLKNKI